MDDQIVTLSSGLFFKVGDWDDGMVQVAIDGVGDAGIDGDSCLVTPDQAAFMLADLNRWLILDVKTANMWFANALKWARDYTAADIPLSA